MPGESVSLRSGGGATAVVHLHGAHVTSWCPAPDGIERLFLSETSRFDSASAIRGGIPVIFPQFAAEGPIMRHGFARVREWQLVKSGYDEFGNATATLSLSSNAETRRIWPADFLAEITVTLANDWMSVALTVENTGQQRLEFQAALHSYFRVHDVAACEIVGLHGTRYRLPGNTHELAFDAAERLRIDGEIDRVYVGAPSTLVLREPERALLLDSEHFHDLVVWNPGGKAEALDDMEPGGEQHMLCIEAAAVQDRVQLEAGRRWTGAQRMTAIAASET